MKDRFKLWWLRLLNRKSYLGAIVAITRSKQFKTGIKPTEIKLILAKELKGNELVDTDDGLYQIYEIGKEIRKNKYMLSVKCGAVLANGIFVSTICSDNDANILGPTLEEWEKYQNE